MDDGSKYNFEEILRGITKIIIHMPSMPLAGQTTVFKKINIFFLVHNYRKYLFTANIPLS